MDPIKLLDVANPKKIKDTVNLLIENYENFGDTVQAIADKAAEDSAAALVAGEAAKQIAEESAEALEEAIASQNTTIENAIDAQDEIIAQNTTTSNSAKQIAEEALAMIEQADARSEAATETAENALDLANEAISTSELAMNVATEAKSTVDQAISTGVFGTFVHNTAGISLLHAYMTDNLNQENTDENFYMATPKLVRDALSNISAGNLLIGTEDNPIILSTDIEDGKSYLIGGYFKMYPSTSDIYHFPTGSTAGTMARCVGIGTDEQGRKIIEVYGWSLINLSFADKEADARNGNFVQRIYLDPDGTSGASYNEYVGLRQINYKNNISYIWAPTSGGTAGQILKSNGNNAPTWIDNLINLSYSEFNSDTTNNCDLWSLTEDNTDKNIGITSNQNLFTDNEGSFIGISTGTPTLIKMQNNANNSQSLAQIAITQGSSDTELYAGLTAISGSNAYQFFATPTGIFSSDGKVLSTNDYTTTEKNKLASIEAGAEVNPTSLSELSEDSTHRLVTDTEKATWNAKSEFSGNYNDLTNKPTIPSDNTQLTNGAGYVTQTEVNTSIATKTAVNVNGQLQQTLNFDSDPQSQLDDLKNIFITLTENSGTLTQEQFDTLDGDDNNYIILTIGSNSWIYRLTEKDSQYSIYMRTARVYPINFGGFTLGVDYVSINRNTLSYTIDTLCPYPMGSIYISVENVSPAGIVGGTWEALGEGYTLWTTTTSGQGGQTIEAGLPNITGDTQDSVYHGGWADNTNGAFSADFVSKTIASIGSGSSYGRVHSSFDASQANAIYGNSDTVQPPAIKVYMWKRVD